MSVPTRSSVEHSRIDQQQERQHRVETTAATVRTSSAFVFVPRHGSRRHDNMENITPRPLPGDCKNEEWAFLEDFQQHVIDLIREFRRNFPYRQLIQWSMEYGNDKEHTLHILVKPSQSMNQH